MKPISSVSSVISKDSSVDGFHSPIKRPARASFRFPFNSFNLANRRSNSVAYDTMGRRIAVSKKIRLDHLQRQAYIYIRQSTLQQVYHNQESGRRQYGLQEKAMALGWPGSALEIVDEDQGFSGQDKERPGLRRLMEAVSSGEVGAVFCLEVSRLSRCNSAWHALIELCAWQDTLLIDEEGVYDPNLWASFQIPAWQGRDRFTLFGRSSFRLSTWATGNALEAVPKLE